MAMTLGPASTEQTYLATINRLCKSNPASPDAYNQRAIQVALLNEELQELCSEGRSLKKSNIGNEIQTVANQRLYNLPNDCLQIVDAYCGPLVGQLSTAVRLSYKSTEYLYSAGGPGWWSRIGLPYWYYIDDQGVAPNFHQIGLFPQPGITAYTITLWYTTKANTLVNDGDYANIDPRLDLCLCYRVASRIMHERRDPYFADLYTKYAEEKLMKFKEANGASRQPMEALNSFSGEGDDW